MIKIFSIVGPALLITASGTVADPTNGEVWDNLLNRCFDSIVNVEGFDDADLTEVGGAEIGATFPYSSTSWWTDDKAITVTYTTIGSTNAVEEINLCEVKTNLFLPLLDEDIPTVTRIIENWTEELLEAGTFLEVEAPFWLRNNDVGRVLDSSFGNKRGCGIRTSFRINSMADGAEVHVMFAENERVLCDLPIMETSRSPAANANGNGQGNY